MEVLQDENGVMIQEPLLDSSVPSKGGFKTLPFIIVNSAFEMLANQGLSSNLIIYLTQVYGMGNAAAANVIFYFNAATNFTPVLGACLADSYVGRYRTIGWGSIISFLGMILMWLTTIVPHARIDNCDEHNGCKSPVMYRYILLYASFVLMSIGAGGVRACSLSFGTDQLEKADHLNHGRILESFISWYYVSKVLAVLGACTCLVYIQDHMGWIVGYGVPSLLMLFSALSFFLASPFYIKKKPKSTIYIVFVQVLVASYKNKSFKVSSEIDTTIYYQKNGSTLELPSDRFRFLNKACIIKDRQRDLTFDGKVMDPWSLTTIDNVEEAKSIIRIIPIWSTGIMMAVSVSQGSFVLLQASSMDRHITSSFEIPAASLTIFLIIALVMWIFLFDSIILPLLSMIMGRTVRLSAKKKMGTGLLLSCGSMAWLAIVESIRRRRTIESSVPMSVMWLVPHFIIAGIAEALNAIGQNEFYYSELPKDMSSIALNLQGVGMSVAYLVASFILTMVNDITKVGGKSSWISDNINEGHYDYYYWLLASLCLLNFVYFIACSKAYDADQESE